MLDFSKADFDKTLKTTPDKKIIIKSKYPLAVLGGEEGICEIKIGGTPARANAAYFTGEHLWVSIAEMNGQIITDTKEKITDEAIKTSNVKLIPEGTTLLSFKLSIGKTAIAGADLYTNEAIAALIPKDKEKVLDKYLFCIFNGELIDLKNVGNKAFGKSLNSTYLNNDVKIPLPPIDIQQQIIDECAKVEEEYNTSRMTIEEYRKKIAQIFENMQVIVGRGKSIKISMLLITVIGEQTKIPQEEIMSTGAYPVITQEAEREIAGYTNNDKPITDLPLIVFGDHSCTFKYVDYPFVRGADGTQLMKINPDIADTQFMYYLLRNTPIANQGKYERHYKYLKETEVYIPSLADQQRIIVQVEQYEAEIRKAQTIMDGCAARKKAILDKYLN